MNDLNVKQYRCKLNQGILECYPSNTIDVTSTPKMGKINNLAIKVIGIQAPKGTEVIFNQKDSNDKIVIGCSKIYQLELNDNCQINDISFTLPTKEGESVIIDTLDIS